MTVKGATLHLYRLTLPLIVTTIVVVAYLFLPSKIDLVGDKSASDYMAGFFSTLPGFFIAALAAVVAFTGGDLDKEMPDVTVKMTVNGDTAPVAISLRVFLSYLFSYLTIISFAGFFVCVGGALIAPNIVKLMQSIQDPYVFLKLHSGLLAAYLAVIVFLSASVVLCTMQGLYFLAERVHQSLLD